MAEPKIGIIGAGGIAPSHIEGFLAAGAEVVAIANRTVSKAQSLAGRYAIPLVCSSLDEMLAKAGPLDAVAIVAPTFMHAPLVVQALRAGLHVFCEKPPALNSHEAEAMADAAARSGKVLMFNFNNRARPEAQAMMEFIQRGGVGRINSAQAAWVRQMGIPGYGGWFTNKKYAGGGAMIDLIHMADLALYFMDFPKPDYVLASNFYNFQHDEAFRSDYGEQIEAESSSGGQQAVMDVETACHAMVTFKTGQCLMIRSSWAEMVERERASVTFQGAWAGGTLERIFSTQGGPLVADTTDGFGRAAADNGKNSYIDRCKLFVLDNGKIIERPLVFGAGQDDMGRRANVANFVKTVRGEARPLNTPNQAVRLMKIIDAIYESAATKQPVSVAG